MPAPVIVPPDRPAPAATEVTVPPLLASAAQAQALPFHFATCPPPQTSPPSASLSVSSANPAGFPATPVHVVPALKSALGAAASSWRGTIGV